MERINKGKSIIDFPENYTIVDIETTGLDTKYDSIIEIAAIKVRNEDVIDTFTTLVNPPYIDLTDFPEITDLTGITQDMLNDAPSEQEAITKFFNFLGDDIVVGHNVNFDINFLYDSLYNTDKYLKNNFIDTLRFARKLLPELKHHRLSDVAIFFAVDTTNAHRALKDCEITLQCYEHLKQLALEKYGTLDNFKRSFVIKKNISHAKDLIAENTDFDDTHPFYKKVCVFTGALEKMPRKDAMQIVVNVGGICADNVTKSTNYLILGNTDYCAALKGRKSNKHKRAEELKAKGYDITIISENTFYDIIEY